MSMPNQQIKYGADIVFCIDSSGSMADVIDAIRESSLVFHQQLTDALEEEGKYIDQIRIRFIAFGGYNDPPVFKISPFYSLPLQSDEMHEFVHDMDFMGFDEEAGLDALAIAFQSDWDHSMTKQRHVIMFYTDEPPHPLGNGTAPGVDLPIPKSLEELKSLWDSMDKSAKRLVLVTTDDDPWPQIASWNNTVWKRLKGGGQQSDVRNMSGIMRLLVNSIQ